MASRAARGGAGGLFAAVLLILLKGFSGSLAGNCCSSGVSGGTANDPVRTGMPVCRGCQPRDLPGYVKGVLAQTDASTAAAAAQRIFARVSFMYSDESKAQLPVVVTKVVNQDNGAVYPPGNKQGGLPKYDDTSISRISIPELANGGSYMARNIEGRDGIFRNAMVWFFDETAGEINTSVQNGFVDAATQCVKDNLNNPMTTLDACAICIRDRFASYGTNQGVLVMQGSTTSQGQAQNSINWHHMAHMLTYSAGLRTHKITVFMLASNPP